MVELTDIPLEILQNIIGYLNVLDNKGTPLLRYVSAQYCPAHVGITFHSTNPDLSLFDAMRVCKSWRDSIFQQVFREDVSKWSPERWQEEIDRFRTVERLALIEVTRVCVVNWRKALGDDPVVPSDEEMSRRAVFSAPLTISGTP